MPKRLDLDILSKAGKVPDRNGLTRAGRALQKHGGRSGSAFPKPTGSYSQINHYGQHILDDILTHPSSRTIFDETRRFGKIIDIEVPNLGGARFSSDGKFIGFLEP